MSSERSQKPISRPEAGRRHAIIPIRISISSERRRDRSLSGYWIDLTFAMPEQIVSANRFSASGGWVVRGSRLAGTNTPRSASSIDRQSCSFSLTTARSLSKASKAWVKSSGIGRFPRGSDRNRPSQRKGRRLDTDWVCCRTRLLAGRQTHDPTRRPDSQAMT